MTKSQLMDSVVYRLIETGIPTTVSKQIGHTVDNWVRCCGIEWTIKRLKSIKLDYINYLAGLPMDSPWIARKANGVLKGPFSYFFRGKRTDKKRIFRSFCSLMMYTRWTATKISQSQTDKFLVGLNAPSCPSSKLILDGIRKSMNIIKSTRSKPYIDRRDLHLVLYRGSDSKRSPVYGEESNTQQDINIGKELQIFMRPGGMPFYYKYEELFDPIIKGTFVHNMAQWPSERTTAAMMSKGGYSSPYSGKISFIQEPGFKLRYVANPYRILQIALKPLGKSIYDLVSTLPWDCTFDQTKHISHVQNHLKDNKKCHSVDLSSATDFFPFDLQEEALRCYLGNIKDISLFKEVSRGLWKSPLGDLSWKQGQPLGLYPSFGSFTLTHGLLLFYLNDFSFNNDFFVVGDDVIILDDDLLLKYRNCLKELGCPVSEDKCLSSNSLCEFAGKLIQHDAVYPQLKWRKLSDDNFLDIARNFGPSIAKFMTPRQRVIYDKVAGLLPPLGCNHGNGETFIEKFVSTERALDIGQRTKKSVMSLNKQCNRVLHEDIILKNCRDIPIKSILSTFDEKVEEVLTKHISTVFTNNINCLMSVENLQSMIGGIQSIPDQLGLSHLFPVEQSPGYSTMLVLMERRFLIKQ